MMGYGDLMPFKPVLYPVGLLYLHRLRFVGAVNSGRNPDSCSNLKL